MVNMRAKKPLTVAGELHRRIKLLAVETGVSLKDVTAMLLEDALAKHEAKLIKGKASK